VEIAEFEGWLRVEPVQRRPLVMGVLNVTPDSFSDGGQYATTDRAVAHAQAMAAAGADLIDVGGESTKPGSHPVLPEEQMRRVVPVLQAVRDLRLGVACSIDTTSAEVAAAALDAGATVINDISAGRDDEPAMFQLAARRRCPIILMHMLGRPKTMQQSPTYLDVTGEVAAFLQDRLIKAGTWGVEIDRILLDPGIGFGKNTAHNLELLRRLAELTTLGRPLVIGTSRKRFIGQVTGVADPDQRLFGTAATVAWSLANGASIVRVHDVEPMVQVVRMCAAIIGGEAADPSAG
jgi:dihydropteroate synthase